MASSAQHVVGLQGPPWPVYKGEITSWRSRRNPWSISVCQTWGQTQASWWPCIPWEGAWGRISGLRVIWGHDSQNALCTQTSLDRRCLTGEACVPCHCKHSIWSWVGVLVQNECRYVCLEAELCPTSWAIIQLPFCSALLILKLTHVCQSFPQSSIN